MNREIKFRAWDGEKMRFPNLIDFGYPPIYTCYNIDYLKPGHFDTENLMQFTGLYDVDGNAVYESDIIQNCDTKELQKVYFDPVKAAWYCDYISQLRVVALADSIGNLNKVIGNIFENHELLNQ